MLEASRSGPKECANKRVTNAECEPRLLKRDWKERGIRYRENNAGENRDRREEKEPVRQLISEKQKRAERRDHGLNIQDHVNDGRISVFEREREENGADGGAGESGKK